MEKSALPLSTKESNRTGSWYHYEQYNVLYNDFNQSQFLKKQSQVLHRRKINYKIKNNRRTDKASMNPESSEIISKLYIDSSPANHKLIRSDYAFTEPYKENSETSSLFEDVVGIDNLDGVIFILDDLIKENSPGDESTENVSEKSQIELESNYIDSLTIFWSSVISNTEKAMQLNLHGGTDSGFQLLLGILICDGLLNKAVIPGFRRICDILQRRVLPEVARKVTNLSGRAVLLCSDISERCKSSSSTPPDRSDQGLQWPPSEASCRSVSTEVDSRMLGPYHPSWLTKARRRRMKERLNTSELCSSKLREMYPAPEHGGTLAAESASLWDHFGADCSDPLLEDYEEYKNPMLSISRQFQEKLRHIELKIANSHVLPMINE